MFSSLVAQSQVDDSASSRCPRHSSPNHHHSPLFTRTPTRNQGCTSCCTLFNTTTSNHDDDQYTTTTTSTTASLKSPMSRGGGGCGCGALKNNTTPSPTLHSSNNVNNNCYSNHHTWISSRTLNAGQDFYDPSLSMQTTSKFKYGPYLTHQEYQVEGYSTTIEELNKLQKYCEESPQETIEKTLYLKELIMNSEKRISNEKSSNSSSMNDHFERMSPPKLENCELLISTPSSMKTPQNSNHQLFEKQFSNQYNVTMMKHWRHHYGGLKENIILFLIGLIFVLLYILVVHYLLNYGS
ncbi:hypothetical protein C9374_010246 [Naegleria lovaniensis]|uniref:Uncharacterized protein n=1 Tax=Naegleria lovaniensis TaxID=51637 RepID=A0AA88KJF8_NAELO|nr:uncharacterized protein C9374_010246 [Naegleria lovaniensis]KAG2374872.1 hypothetical protein C9374_010246 [Naegleria lovaniensis]